MEFERCSNWHEYWDFHCVAAVCRSYPLQEFGALRQRILSCKSAEWNRARAHAVIVEFVRANGEMTYGEVAGAFGLHPVTVNRIALRAGQKRGSGRRRGKLGRKATASRGER